MIRVLVRTAWLKFQLRRAQRELQRERVALARKLLGLYFEIPPSQLHHSRWEMNDDTLKDLLRCLTPGTLVYPLAGIGFELTILGRPVVIDHDAPVHDINLTCLRPAGPETGPDDDGAFCNGIDSGERAPASFVSQSRTTPFVYRANSDQYAEQVRQLSRYAEALASRECPECGVMSQMYATPFGPQCWTCASIDYAERRREQGN